jgi:hypothetical protein
MKIEVNNITVEACLEWLSKSPANVLIDINISEIIRYLLKEVSDLKEIVNKIEYEREQQEYLEMGDDL